MFISEGLPYPDPRHEQDQILSLSILTEMDMEIDTGFQYQAPCSW